MMLGAIILAGGCANWQRLDVVADRVLSSCSGKCAPESPQRKCLLDLRYNVAAAVAKVPDSCATWAKP